MGGKVKSEKRRPGSTYRICQRRVQVYVARGSCLAGQGSTGRVQGHCRTVEYRALRDVELWNCWDQIKDYRDIQEKLFLLQRHLTPS